MYDQPNITNSRRMPMTNIKSRSSSSTIFKRQSSGHIPSLTANVRPLSNSTNISQRSIINNKTKRKTDDFENDSFEYDVPTSNYVSVRKQQQVSSVKRVKSEQPITPKKKILTEDGSLRIITSTVQGMKHWTSKHLPYPILFEVFGKLDSQVTSLSSSTNIRQFSLIDEKDRVECIFAEMDQSFSNIDRDVQLRIICRLESDNNIARCMTIRVAGKDEWHERRAVIKQCDIQLNDDDINSKKFKKNFLNNRKGSK